MSETNTNNTDPDDGLKNPMRFSIDKPRNINIGEKLRHPDFVNKQVTDIEVCNGQMYVYWERSVDTGTEGTDN